jgi:hypothetical protein
MRKAQLDGAHLVQSGPLAGLEPDLERAEVVVELSEVAGCFTHL